MVGDAEIVSCSVDHSSLFSSATSADENLSGTVRGKTTARQWHKGQTESRTGLLGNSKDIGGAGRKRSHSGSVQEPTAVKWPIFQPGNRGTGWVSRPRNHLDPEEANAGGYDQVNVLSSFLCLHAKFQQFLLKTQLHSLLMKTLWNNVYSLVNAEIAIKELSHCLHKDSHEPDHLSLF